MAELKEKVLRALHSSRNLEVTLNDLSNYQENLLNNYTNPAFEKKDQNLILKKYIDIRNLGKALYRYKALQEGNYLAETQEEREDIKNFVLKGGISYNHYVWHSENGEHTCDECKSLDGQVFDFYDEIPERPHPNCKCYVEIVEGDNENSSPEQNENEEPCDCWDKIDDLVAETDSWQEEIESEISELSSTVEEDYNLLYEIKNLKQQVENSQSELSYIEPCGDNCVAYVTGMAVQISDDSKLEEIIYNLTKYNKAARESYVIFLMAKHEMEQTRDGMDKYYHAKANCTSAELSEMHAKWAMTWSRFKEVKDFLYKTIILHQNVKDVYEDCKRDLKADKYGIQKAKEHGYCSEKVKNVYKDVFKQE